MRQPAVWSRTSHRRSQSWPPATSIYSRATCLVEGSLVSLAVLIPETIVALDQAVRRGDLLAARAAHDIIYPLARAIYGAPPPGHATARLKTCLKLLGRLESDVVRPPIGPLANEEVAMLQDAL